MGGKLKMDGIAPLFSSPLSGTFFQYGKLFLIAELTKEFSSPFSGTFFQYGKLFLIAELTKEFSSPFSGTFFQLLVK